MSQNFIVLAALFGLMYVMLIRPQKKQVEARKKMMENLSVDDIITTIGGIKGKIISVMEDFIILEIAENIRIEVLKSAVGQVIVDEEDEDDDDDEEDAEESDEDYVEDEDDFEDEEDYDKDHRKL